MATEQRIAIALAAAGALLLVGCVSPFRGGVQPPAGGVFALHTGPLETNFDATPIGTKLGVAHLKHITNPFFVRFPVVTWGDGTIESAARTAGISKIHYVDYRLLNVLGIYVQVTVLVSGD